jgi:Ca2+-binding EF-hand superfamily protein
LPEDKTPPGPPGLPKWFAEYDQDGDGQVGLYEWRRMGKPIKEFVPMDRNEDGYLTPKEVLDHQAEQAKANPPPTSPKK